MKVFKKEDFIMDKKMSIMVVLIMMYATIGGIIAFNTGLGLWMYEHSIYGLLNAMNYNLFQVVYWASTTMGWIFVICLAFKRGLSR